MSVWSKASVLLRSALRRNRMEQDMDAEMRFHVARFTDDLIRSGVAREEAERRARIEFGNIEPLKEECRQARGLRWLDESSQDLRYAGRMMRKAPAFAFVAVLTLALGIGANTAIFSVLHAWVLQPLPYANPDQLVFIWSTGTKAQWRSRSAPADLYDWRKDSPVFDQVCGWITPTFTLQQSGDADQVVGARVSGEFFKMLGASPQLGRDFLPDDDRPGASPVAILSNELWTSRFAADSSVVGRTIPIDGQQVTVIGIAPPRFHVPLMGKAMLWMPLALSEEDRGDRQGRYIAVFARMKPGVNLARASIFLKTLARRLEVQFPASNAGRTVQLISLRDEIGSEGAKDPAVIVFGIVACVLLIACSNVASLIVSRAVGRQKEMAVRLAIGAGRGRLLRQLLTENLVLFLFAGALSVGFALWGVRWIANSIPPQVRNFLPNFGILSLDLSTLVYTFLLALVCGVVFGFAPAFHCWRVDVHDGLKEAAARISASARATRLKSSLIVLEISLALIVLVASGLLVKGLVKMYSSEPGFEPRGLIQGQLGLSDKKYKDATRIRGFYEQVLDRLRTLPGIQGAAICAYGVYTGNIGAVRYAIEGRPIPAEPVTVWFDTVSPEFFSTMGTPLLRGRAFTEQDRADSMPVVIINQTMAERDWPREDPIGKHLLWGNKLGRTATVVGVVKNTGGIDDTDRPTAQIFLPFPQLPTRAMEIVVRTATGSMDVAPAIRRAIQDVDKEQAVLRVDTMLDLIRERQAQFSVVGEVTSFFAMLTLFLAAMGIYAVMAYSVAARKQEFGIRLALGAGRRDLAGMVLGQGMKLALLGLVIGLACAFGVTRLMTSILYQVSPTDIPTFIGISVLLLSVAVLACYLPARRASGIEPTRVLRYE